ncbi:MAG: proline dehydrogenase family protein [Chlamydiota bacterium]
MGKLSFSLEQAVELLSSVEGKVLSSDERKKLSLELSSYIHQELLSKESPQEQKLQKHQIALLKDPKTRSLLFHLIDQSFRSSSFQKTGNQIAFLLLTHGIPQTLPISTHLKLFLFKLFRKSFPKQCISSVQEEIKKQVFDRTLPYENISSLFIKNSFLKNLALVDDLFLGEEERKKRLKTLKSILENPDVTYLSIRTTDLLPSIPLGEDESIDILVSSLQELYEVAKQSSFQKFISLSAESYDHLLLAHQAFKKTLDLPSFSFFSAGIVLPAYFPDSFEIQKDLTEWAKKRKAFIKITLVKGGFLGKEQIIAGKKGWIQPTFPTKIETDANFKKMILWGTQKKHFCHVHLGVATQNLFDLSFFLLLQRENHLSLEGEIELFEKKSTTLQNIILNLSSSPVRLFSPFNPSGQPAHISSYVIQKMSSQIGQDAFFSSSYEEQEEVFLQSLSEIDSVTSSPRRDLKEKAEPFSFHRFENESDSPDLSLSQDTRFLDVYPISVGSQEIFSTPYEKKKNPFLEYNLYSYVLANALQVQEAVEKSKSEWKNFSFSQKSQILHQAAQLLSKKRKDFLFLLANDGGKILSEASEEIDRAIDSIEYYRLRMEKQRSLLDLTWEPKGLVLILSSWRQGCLFPAGSIAASLISDNSVLFKPSLETIALSWEIAKIFWEAGVPKEALQFLPTTDRIIQEVLLEPRRIQKVLFSGRKKTEELLVQSYPGISFSSLTEGTNTLIVTASADKKLALHNLLSSAFYHGGQDFFSVSIAILEREIYEDLTFRNELRDAVASLQIGHASDKNTHIPYLMGPLTEENKRSFYKLERNEGWLLESKFQRYNPLLVSPGIKLGLTKDSYSYTHRPFAPFLGLMAANDFSEALTLANQIKNPLSVNLQSLDQREHIRWRKKILGTQQTINVPTSTYGVRKAPFGSTPKLGGPNFLTTLTRPKQYSLPQEKFPLNKKLQWLLSVVDKFSFTEEEKKVFEKSLYSYSYWWHRMENPQDPTKLLGQDNLFGYIPKKVTLRMDEPQKLLDGLRVCGAALACLAPLEVSSSLIQFQEIASLVQVVEENEQCFLDRLPQGNISFLRLVSSPSLSLLQRATLSNCTILDAPILANGRYELLNYLEEVSLTYDYHRHGSLGIREAELRKTPL